ncbi:putative adenosine [Lyophyllum shimeji]|uniref:adenosine deaminase n=1 Tax=Lyophyllum shimeji TaxID=47721 RepID=A0A9P3US66_LYOSH|nr:putative adenosine [Lyophyllum shimeji]
MYYAIRFLDTALLPASSPEGYPKIIKSGIKEEPPVRNSPAITGPCGIATLLYWIGRPQLLERLFDVDGTESFRLRVHTGRDWLNDIYVKRQGRDVEIGFIVDKLWAQDAVRYKIEHEDGSPYRSGKWTPLSVTTHGTEWETDSKSVAVQSAAIAKAIWWWNYHTFPDIDVSWSGITTSEEEDLATWLLERKVRLAEEAENETSERHEDSPNEYYQDRLACRADCGEKKPSLQCTKCRVTPLLVREMIGSITKRTAALKCFRLGSSEQLRVSTEVGAPHAKNLLSVPRGSSSKHPRACVTAYEEARAALIDEDRALRRDRSQRTPEEARADQLIRDIRAAEASTIWKQEHPSIPHPFPGMEFLTGREIIVKTKLFALLSKMPKGALLHCHLDGTVNVPVLLKLALKQPALHVRVSQKLTVSSIGSVLPEFRGLPPNEFSDAPGLTDEAYEAGRWVSLRTARETFDASLGGPEGFDKWVVGAMTINPTEAYKTHNTIKKIWQKFTSTFIVSTGLIRFAPIFPEYVREFLKSSIDDGISYIEARVNFLYKYMVGADGQENVPHREWLLMFDRVLSEVKAEMKEQGREPEFIGAKIIYSTIRFITPKELEWYLEDCIALKKEFPHLIAGFDLVGDENELKPLIDYIEPLQWFRVRQKEEGVDIPFIFHAGETLGDGTPTDSNLYDAILLGTKRIGHGYSLVKHPKLVETCRQKGIAIEVCPISNEILRLTSSMPMHPLPILLNNGVPVALCSDDPSVFGNMGLTFDFFQVLVASELTGLSTLGQLARDSLEHSTLNEDEKRRAILLWEKQWNGFVSWMLEQEQNLPSQVYKN